MSDLRKELTEAMDLLDAAHKAVQECNDPQKIGPLMGVVKQHFLKTEDILSELYTQMERGNEEAKSVLVDLAPRAIQSTEVLKASQAHVLQVFTIATGFHTTDPNKLPRA